MFELEDRLWGSGLNYTTSATRLMSEGTLVLSAKDVDRF